MKARIKRKVLEDAIAGFANHARATHVVVEVDPIEEEGPLPVYGPDDDWLVPSPNGILIEGLEETNKLLKRLIEELSEPIEEEKKCLEENCRICQPPQKIEETGVKFGLYKTKEPELADILFKVADRVDALIREHNKRL